MKNRAVKSSPIGFFAKHKLTQAIISAPVICAPAIATAEVAPQSVQISISSGTLEQALHQLGSQTKTVILFTPDLTQNLTSNGFKGSYSVQQALEILLDSKGLEAVKQADGSYTLRALAGVTALDRVTVKGREARFGDAPVEPDGFKAEYQTTATKMAMPLKETPQAISVVTRDLLDARQVDGLHHALELTSGTQGGAGGFAAPSGPFTGRGNYAQVYNVRGYSLDYFHGVKTDGFSAGAIADIDLAAYERVEVIKGPSGFFGQGPIGGIINLSRKKPKTEFDARISGRVGSYDTYRTEADITGALTEDENLRGRLVMAHGTEGSFVDDISTDTSLFAPSFEAVINDKTRVLLQLLYQEEEFDMNNGQPAFLEGDRVKLFNLPRSYQFGAVGDERSESEIKDISVRVDHELSDRWLSTLVMQRSETNRDTYSGNYAFLYYGYTYVGRRRDISETERWAGELRLEGTFDAFDQEHRLLLGVERNHQQRERNNGFGLIYTESGMPAFADLYARNFKDIGIVAKADIPLDRNIGATVDTDNSAFYAQSVLTLTERTKLLVNARYDRSKYKGTDAAGSYLTEKKDNELTMRLGLTQELNDNLSAYATYGESFTPNVDSRDRNEQPLDAQRGEGYELGLKGEWFDNKLGASLAVYRQDLTNRPLTDPENTIGEDYSIAAGLHRTEGIEFEVAGSPMPGLNLAVAATWMDNEFLDKNDPFYGLAIDGSVERQFSLYANYELQNGPLKGLASGLMWLRVGEQQVLPYQSGSYSQAYIDGYDRVDLDFSYKGVPDWNLSLVIRNVFDEHYVEQGSSRFANSYFVGAPRSALFKATYKF